MLDPPTRTERDAQTLAMLVRGDAQGLRRLLEDHGGVVRGFLRRKFDSLLDHWQLDEAMSLAAIRVWQSAPRFSATHGNLRAWLAVIARDRALNILARQQGGPLVAVGGIDPTILGVATSQSEAERLRLIVDVHRCIDQMPQLQRAVLLADLNAGITLPEPVIAERLQSTSRAVWVARRRGRRELRRQLGLLGHRPLIDGLPGKTSTTPREHNA